MVLLEQLVFYTSALGITLLSAFEAKHKELTDCLVWKIQQRILIIKREHMDFSKSRGWTSCLNLQTTEAAKPCMISEPILKHYTPQATVRLLEQYLIDKLKQYL